MIPYDFHMTAVAKNGDNSLTAYGLKTLETVRESIQKYVSSQAFLKFYRKNPTLFNTVLRWKGNVNVEIIGLPRKAQDFKDYNVPNYPHHDRHVTLKQKITPILRAMIRRFCKRNIDIKSLFKCKRCHSPNVKTLEIAKFEKHYQCCDCQNTFLASKNNIFWLI
ncbi:hypothetical protein N9V26_01395 [Amylibacter sp.]|nr:hypothetical protein [Amylibacter sp.]